MANHELTTDATSRIHFDTLKHDMTRDNKITSPIDANLTIRNSRKPTGRGGKRGKNNGNAGQW